jgi:hypothetical protein
MYFPSIVLRFVSDMVKFMTWKKNNFFNSKCDELRPLYDGNEYPTKEL